MSNSSAIGAFTVSTGYSRRVQYADVDGDRHADAIGETLVNQFVVSTGPGLPMTAWLQHGPTLATQMQYADVNGDGRADALYFDTSRSGAVWVSLSTGSGFAPSAKWLQHGPSTPDQMQYADVNGDGKADALYFDTWRSSAVWVSISSGTGFSNPVLWTRFGASLPNQIRYADANGDGKADVLYFDTFHGNGLYVGLSTGAGFTAPALWLQHGPSIPDQIEYKDVNGDGKVDALYFDTFRSNGVWVSVSNGIGFGAATKWLQHGQSTPDQLQYADVNGDGKADALYFDTYRSNGVWATLSSGSGFSLPTLWLQHGASTPDLLRFADVNGDGRADALYYDALRSGSIWVSYGAAAAFTTPAPFSWVP